MRRRRLVRACLTNDTLVARLVRKETCRVVELQKSMITVQCILIFKTIETHLGNSSSTPIIPLADCVLAVVAALRVAEIVTLWLGVFTCKLFM